MICCTNFIFLHVQKRYVVALSHKIALVCVVVASEHLRVVPSGSETFQSSEKGDVKFNQEKIKEHNRRQ